MADVTAYMQPKITITGDLGSGKSVVSKLLQAQLGYEIYSTGKVQREIAARYGMSTLELNQYAETHPEIDQEIDSAFVQLNHRPEGLIVDSRLAWHFMPNSFRLYLSVPIAVAAARIMADPTRKGEQYKSLDQAVADIRARKQSENRRFLDMYGADCANMDHFDYVADTNGCTPEAVSEAILQAFEAWQKRPVRSPESAL
jgi:CMP/dCMP kinase